MAKESRNRVYDAVIVGQSFFSKLDVTVASVGFPDKDVIGPVDYFVFVQRSVTRLLTQLLIENRVTHERSKVVLGN